MSIKNTYSEKSPAESIGNIQQVLAEHGAQNISIDYEAGEPQALEFVMQVGPNMVPFRLVVDARGMLQAMKDDKNVPKSKCNINQAKRTAWKNKLEWIQIQLAEIASNQAKMEQLLLGYAVMPNGDTVYRQLTTGQMLIDSGEDQMAIEGEVIEDG